MIGYQKKQGPIEVILEDLDKEDVSSVLQHLADINELIRQLSKQKVGMERDLKEFLKEKKWTRYLDPKTKISVTIDVFKDEVVDKKHMKDFLSAAQLSQIVRVKTEERLMIVSPKSKSRLTRKIRGG